jgi:alpha-amylase
MDSGQVEGQPRATGDDVGTLNPTEASREGQRRRPRAARVGTGFAGPLAALALALACAAPARALTPSPADWRDLVLYQVVTDRFADGDPANDAVEGNYVPADGARIHGGDFAGLRQRLDYLQGLGVDGVWVSPVVLNANAEYHGYAARDLFSIAPHFGSLAELRALAADLHARGMYLIIDVVCNHLGTLITSTGAGYPAYSYPAAYPLSWSDPGKRFAPPFDDLSRFHAYGNISNYSDPEQILGQLAGLNDLRTEDPAVRAALVQAAAFLIDSTDCDGFRVDTVKHVEMDFWPQWCAAVHAHATAAGKARFFLFGEVWDGNDAKVGSYTGTLSGGAYAFDSMLHYPMYYTMGSVFASGAAPADIPARDAQLGSYDPTSQEQLVTFLDNHDNARFVGYGGAASQDEAKARTALAFLLTSRGVPCVYYGTEQDFDGGGDPYCREDMWDGQWDFGPSDGDNFDVTHPLARWMSALTTTRRRHEALRRGTTTVRYSASAAAGLHAFTRETASDTVLVALSNAAAPQIQAAVPTPWLAGTVLVDALEPAVRETVGTGGALDVRLRARGARVFESLASHAAAVTPLGVIAVFPGHDGRLSALDSPLRVAFDRAPDPASVAAAASISPPMAGSWQVSGAGARFFPAAAWTPGVTYTWGFSSALRGADGSALAAPFHASFITTGIATGVTLPAGYAIDQLITQGPRAPEALLRAPWLGDDVMLVGDAAWDRLFTFTLGGDLGSFQLDSRWTRPEGIARAADGTLGVCDATGVYLVDARRMTTSIVSGSTATRAGAIVWAGGAYGDRFLICDPTNNRVSAVTTAGAVSAFTPNSSINGPEALAFGPGGAWGTDLYVADANLGTISTATNGFGRIVRVSPTAVVTTLVTDTALLNGASGMAFDTQGRFGGDLFVADILNERIVRITSAGVASVFASGFHNLSGSQCLAFGPDGALYVADAGANQTFSNNGGSGTPPRVLRIAAAGLTLGVADAEPPGLLALAPPSPNPTRGGATLRFTLARAGHATLALYDVSGRRVRTLADGALAAGPHEARWDGRDTAGARVRAGLYFATLAQGGESRVARVVVIE